jgi:peptidoglycan/xylan/chitin deacetylase (PgdA/CDA1 family)
LRRTLMSGGAILCFHSVTTREHPADGDGHISLDDLRSCVRRAGQWGEFVQLSELIGRHQSGRTTSGLIALTFDDAYAALGSEFQEFVRREALPIAVFPVTEAAQTGAAYWWDRVDDLFRRTPEMRWRAFETACGVPDEYRDGQPPEYGPLRPIRQWILSAFAGQWPGRFEPELQALERETEYRTRQRAMTFDELGRLRDLPGLEIGVHTATHPVLPLLADADVRREVGGAYEHLKERFENVLPVLAVPYGLYDARSLRLAAESGMIASLTLSGQTLNAPVPPHALPRICITRTDARARLTPRLLGIPRFWRACLGRQLPLYPSLPSATT